MVGLHGLIYISVLRSPSKEDVGIREGDVHPGHLLTYTHAGRDGKTEV